MSDAEARAGAADRTPFSLARLPTGTKVFLILSMALMPLAVIALFANLQSTRLVDLEARSRLRVAIAESSRALEIELRGDIAALKAATETLGDNRLGEADCARVQGIFAELQGKGPKFAMIGRDGRRVCGATLDREQLPATPVMAGEITARLVPQRGLTLLVAAERGDLIATIWFPRDYLAEVGRPDDFMPVFSSMLEAGRDQLVLEPMAVDGLDRQEAVRTPIGVAGLSLTMTVRGAAMTASQIVAALLPLLMWAAAAGIGWFVVDRLLIRPLKALRTAVAAYQPGGAFPELPTASIPAMEIASLGDTFRAITRTVALHEADLAEGLNRQTRLTREVHHRVKNNLQVIASLINFHARGAVSADASAAYASIQRRVDALAVVHRNHFAELEENRGLGLRSVIGELASNIRATAPDESADMSIALDLEPFLATQDVAVAVAFLLTEMVELAVASDPQAQIRISLQPTDDAACATLRVSARALIESDLLTHLVKTRYGRVMEGLSRQLRSKLHHEPLTGVYEIGIAVTGRD